MGIDYHRETSCFFEVQMLQGRGEASLLCLETPEQHGPVLPHGERGGEKVTKSEKILCSQPIAGGERRRTFSSLLRHLLRVRSTAQAAWKKSHLRGENLF